MSKSRKRHPLYKTWFEMHQRCKNPAKWQFRLYGGRGISVCERWDLFANFCEDMGERPSGFTLDRLDCDGNYEPSNCRWADKLTQANNARNNRKILVDGEVIGLCEAGRKYGIKFGTIWARLKNGWSEQDAATVPILRKRSTSKYRTACSNMRANV
jgi:hypothetical protein